MTCAGRSDMLEAFGPVLQSKRPDILEELLLSYRGYPLRN